MRSPVDDGMLFRRCHAMMLHEYVMRLSSQKTLSLLTGYDDG
jgi:hypothetical protein